MVIMVNADLPWKFFKDGFSRFIVVLVMDTMKTLPKNQHQMLAKPHV